MAGGVRPRMTGIEGRAVLVTGASRGIGLAVSRALAAAGAWVGMVARTGADLERSALEVAGTAIRGDVSSAADVDAIAARVRELIGRAPDAVVNAAGAFALGSFTELDPADFDRQLDVNLRAPFLITRAFLPEMLARRSGHIVNIGSVAGRVALAGNAGSGASKYGLRGLHEVLAVELAGSGVRATWIEPAATDTNLWDALDPDSRDDLPARSQMLRADDVANAVVFALAQPGHVEIATLAIRAVS
jgi:NADP-dependent 3-hydroxy acid dehydrogenase YdfG